MNQPTPKGRTTIYKGVRFKSRLEADFAGFLDRHSMPWIYEPRCYAAEIGGEHVQYLPDFQIAETVGASYIELKPASFPIGADQGRAELYPLLGRMAIIWQEEPEASLQLVLWEYGGSAAALAVRASGADRVWKLDAPGIPLPLLLAGMGQWAAVADRHFNELRSRTGALGDAEAP